MDIDMNVNDEVLVKLTPYALAIMEENHFKLFNGVRYAPPGSRVYPPGTLVASRRPRSGKRGRCKVAAET